MITHDKYYCLNCKGEFDQDICQRCGMRIKQYKNIIRLTSLKRHETPGKPLIQAEEIKTVRDGPMIAQCAALKFHKKGYDVKNTLIIFYPSGMNSLNVPIITTLIDIGYKVVTMFWDTETQSYF